MSQREAKENGLNKPSNGAAYKSVATAAGGEHRSFSISAYSRRRSETPPRGLSARWEDSSSVKHAATEKSYLRRPMMENRRMPEA